MNDVYVSGIGLLTPVGSTLEEHWTALNNGESKIDKLQHGLAAPLCGSAEKRLRALRSRPQLKHADRAVLMGAAAAEDACRDLADTEKMRLGVVMGSSRGATLNWEDAHAKFLSQGRVHATTSPSTTMGSFASIAASHIGARGPALAVSSACTTSLHAVGVAFSLLKAGIADQCVGGGAESSLTPFTFAMLDRAGVYGGVDGDQRSAFPYQPMSAERAGMVMGEGGVCLRLSTKREKNSMARVIGYAGASEAAGLTGITESALGLGTAITDCLTQCELTRDDIDVVVAHGAGTRKGDAAEWAAYENLFGDRLPVMTHHKWLTGHLLGAAGSFSLAMAALYIERQDVPPQPYQGFGGAERKLRKPLRHILVCSLGFGGNVAAMVLGRV